MKRRKMRNGFPCLVRSRVQTFHPLVQAAINVGTLTIAVSNVCIAMLPFTSGSAAAVMVVVKKKKKLASNFNASIIIARIMAFNSNWQLKPFCKYWGP